MKPEEVVRQSLVESLVTEFLFPPECIAIEKNLQTLPHLLHREDVPDRRCDILCYAKNIHQEHALYPLLMIECKAEPLQESTARQVIGYNYFVGACFIGIANQDHVMLGWYDKEKKTYSFQEGLMQYPSMVMSACNT